MRVWIDLTNSPHAVIFAPLVRRLRDRGWDVSVTARAFAQTLELLELYGIEHTVIGHHGGGSRAGKARAAADRVAAMVAFGRRGRFDVALAHGSTDLPMACRVLRVPNTTMFDYEFATLQHSLNCRLASRVLVPDAIPPGRLRRFGVRPPRLVRYPGLKEEYYLADLEPDPGVLDELGLDRAAPLAVVRTPPAVSLYHRFEHPLFAQVLDRLRDQGQVVVLPRTPEQADELRGRGGFTIPAHAIDGPSLVAQADLVVSAGGTMNREAVALGTPVWTTFEGRLGAVDERLIAEGRLRHLQRAEDLALVRRDPGSGPPARAARVRRDPAVLVELLTAPVRAG